MKRRQLIAQRATLHRPSRIAVRNTVTAFLKGAFSVSQENTIGFYWPYKGEINLRALMIGCIAQGAEAALPVVVKKNRPLEFWRWTESMPLQKGIWDIPIPRAVEPVAPTVLLVPLVGFDAAGYRLGHGGGYYDRTLASLKERPFTIGVGYEFQRLQTIHPQAHDIPMDCILTEAGYAYCDHRVDAGIVDLAFQQQSANPTRTQMQ